MMDKFDSDKFVDLAPREWKSERKKPYEPFWGEGALPMAAYIIPFAVMFTVLHFLFGR